jgi:hypothetical protein
MSKPVNRRRRETQRRSIPDSANRPPASPDAAARPARGQEPANTQLERVLDAPGLIRAVPRLAPETVHQLIRYRGLEFSGEILSAVTPAQLASVFDLDLWRPAEATGDEQFDVGRFGEWIEALVECGDGVAARVVAGLDERLVTAGLAGYVRVLDPAARVRPWSGEADELDDAAAPIGGLAAEIGGYVVQAKTADAWDAIVVLLVALEADYRDRFDAVMRGCRVLSNSAPEADGCDDLLPGSAQLLHDVAVEREERRTGHGFLTPADARAFLQMARQPAPAAGAEANAGPGPSFSANPIALAYLRAPEVAAARPTETPKTTDTDMEARDETDASVVALTDLLAEAGAVPGRPRALLAGPADEDSRATSLHALMERARDADEPAFLARGREMAFLANCLMAGCSVHARAFTAAEATDAVVATCELGLEYWPARWPDWDVREQAASAHFESLPETFLVTHDLVTAFQVGWAALHEMSMSAARRLISVLAGLRALDAEIQVGLEVLRRELVKQCAAGTPWRARDPLEVIAILDMLAWTALLGLLDECPVVPEALTATLERRTGAVSPTAFEFVSSRKQIDRAHAFMEMLPAVLLR